MLTKSWIKRSCYVEGPVVKPVNLQVRTGVSAPFEPHMTGDDRVKPVPPDAAVRVPAATYMVGNPS